MATKHDIEQAVADVCVDALTDVVSLSEPHKHVRKSDADTSPQLPAYTLETFESPRERGFDGGTQTFDVLQESGGLVVTVGQETALTIDIGAHVADDGAREASELYDQLRRQFISFTDGAQAIQTLHDDVTSVRLRGNQDVSQPRDDVRGDRLRLVVEYEWYETINIALMESVGIEMGETTEQSSNDSNDTGTVTLSYNFNNG